jgi:hypothetical protein
MQIIYLLNSNVNIVSSCDINYLPNSNGKAYSKGNTSDGSISEINDDGCIAMLIFVSGMFVMMFNCKDNLRLN